MSLGARLLEGIPKRPVILHVDLNRTIIQVDLAGGKTLKDILNNNLSTCCVGFCNTSIRPLVWKPIFDPDGRPLPESQQVYNSEKELENLKKKNFIMTYDEFVDEVIAPKPPEIAHMEKGAALNLWKTVTAKRRSLKNKFCEPGEPGHRFVDPFYNEMHAAMLRDAPDGRKTAETHFVIPSFFCLLQTLWQQQWPFHVVFRTFGRELKEVLKEVEKELAQRNPALWGLVMRNSSLLLLLQQSQSNNNNNNNNNHAHFPWCPISSIYRDNQIGSLVCHGADFSPPDIDEWAQQGFSKHSKVSLAELYEEFTGTPVHSDIEKQNAKKLQLASDATLGSPNRIISSGTEATKRNKQVQFPVVQFRGFVDHYPWWAANGEHESAGKVFPVRISAFANGPGSLRAEDEERMFESKRRTNATSGDNFNNNNNNSAGDTIASGATSPKDFITPISTTGAEDPLQVFFDDNIYINDPEGHSIVDIRDVESEKQEHVSDPETQACFLVRVDPRLAILDEFYFVRKFVDTVKKQISLRKGGKKVGPGVVVAPNTQAKKRNPSSSDEDEL